MRISYLRNADDRVADRVFVFPPMEHLRKNPYIRAENDAYPEMDYCYSPDLSATLLGSTAVRAPPDEKQTSVLQHQRKQSRLNMRRFGKSANVGSMIDRSGAAASSMQRHIADDDESDDDIAEDEAPRPLFVKRAPKAPAVVVTNVSTLAEPEPQRGRLNTEYIPDLPLPPAAQKPNEGGGDINSRFRKPLPSDFRSPPPITSAQASSDKTRTNSNTLLAASSSDLPPGTPPPRLLMPSELEKNLPRPAQRKMSALTSMITKRKSMMSNPLASEYAVFNGRGDPNGIPLRIYFPHADEPTKPLRIVIKRDACVEDVIGFALFQYFDEKRQPMIEQPKNQVIWWNLRICEEDGEIDEDFPALDRARQIQKFAFDEFALEEASSAQVKINEQLSKQRKPSKENVSVVASGLTAGIAAQNDTTAAVSAAAPTPAVVTEAKPFPGAEQIPQRVAEQPPLAKHNDGASTATGGNAADPSVLYRLLKIHVHVSKLVSHTTTVNVPVTMLLADVLVRVCQKWKLNPTDHILKFTETKVDVPMDRPLESLPGLAELDLVKRGSRMSMADILTSGSQSSRRASINSMNASSGKPNFPGGKTIGSSNGLTVAGDPFTGMYQRWTVTRKMPMLVGKTERVFAIDGDYIHIMPPDNRNMFDTSIKTASYHIASVVACKQNRKLPQKFKLSVFRDRDMKSYDFDAANEDECVEIINRVNFLMRINQGEVPAVPNVPSNKYAASSMAGVIPPGIMGAALGTGMSGIGAGMPSTGMTNAQNAAVAAAAAVGVVPSAAGGAGTTGAADAGNVVHANAGYVVVRRDDEYEFFWA